MRYLSDRRVIGRILEVELNSMLRREMLSHLENDFLNGAGIALTVNFRARAFDFFPGLKIRHGKEVENLRKFFTPSATPAALCLNDSFVNETKDMRIIFARYLIPRRMSNA